MHHRLLLATLILACSNAHASFEYTSANAKVSTNVNASFFDSVTITNVPTTDSQGGYSIFTLYKFFGTSGYGGPLDVSITNLQAGSASTSASALLSVVRPGNVTWVDQPSASMYVESPINRDLILTTSSRSITLVNQPLLQQEVQSFHIDSIGYSGRGLQSGTFNRVYSTAALTLTIRVSNVPELSSATMAWMGALLMPLAVHLRRTRRQCTA